MRHQGFHALVYVDDIVSYEASLARGRQAFNYLWDICGRLGLHLAPDKCMAPIKCMAPVPHLVWLVFEVCVERMMLRIPDEKLHVVLEAHNDDSPVSSKYLFRSDLVEHGDEGKPIKKEDATKDEYMLGLKCLETQCGFPSSDVNVLLRQQETVAQDNCTLAWATVRRYSEEILPAASPKCSAHRNYRYGGPTAAAHADHRRQKAPDSRGAYNRATSGAPCPTWNHDPRVMHQVGQWRRPRHWRAEANVRRIVAAHSEAICYSNKSRDKGSASSKQEMDF